MSPYKKHGSIAILSCEAQADPPWGGSAACEPL